MAELLWKLVLKINARAIFLFMILVLAVVLVVMFRQSSRHGQDLSLAGHRIPPSEEHGRYRPASTGVVGSEIEDPFTSAFLMAWLDLEASRRREREAARTAAAPVVVAPPIRAAVAVEASPAPVVAPQWISVKYQGMIARMDGAQIAMVAEVAGGALHTLKVDDDWLVYRVKEVTAQRVLLDAGEGLEAERLTVGVGSRVRKESS